MVKALEDAIKKAQALPEVEQEALAAIIQAEITDEKAWQKRFAETKPTLDKLVDRAKEQYRKGEFGEFPAR
ncbi:MAG: hypothetical protein IT202_06795 [Fimbriimonadaceae bacterium]|nr:hypothetical protein [Fimbriimonadaceae bacterium]MCC6352199.1 hypothetical protein [Fimbriimonadaceae bacterium]QOJ11920.1 MAG: hypothetical protein HRU74_07610 [Chthonomonadaceae bacterium]